jgi:hypothetical protein
MPELRFALKLEQGFARGVLQEASICAGLLLAFQLAERAERPAGFCRDPGNLLLDHLMPRLGLGIGQISASAPCAAFTIASRTFVADWISSLRAAMICSAL